MSCSITLDVTASRKITEAENILTNLKKSPDDRFKLELEKFIITINDIFLHLLDEYNVKFNLKIQHIGFEKFKAIAKKAGNIDAINFLIWYEKEYRNLRNNSVFGHFLEKDYVIQDNNSDISNTCTELLEAVKRMSYYAYENF